MSHRIFATLAVCVAAVVPALNAQRLFVEAGSASSSQSVQVLATAPLSAVTGFQSGVGTYQVLALPDGSKYYAIGTSTTQSITSVDSSFQVPKDIAAFPRPITAATLTPDGSLLAVAAGTLHLFSTATDSELVPGGINVGTNVSVIDVAVGLDGKTIYTLGVTANTTQVNAIDVASMQITGTLGFRGAANSISVGPNGIVYVTLSNELIDINPTTFAQNPAGAIGINGTPGRPAFTTDGQYALVANITPITGTSLLLVSLANRAVVSTSPSLQITLDTLLVTGTNTILGYASATQNAFQITIGTNGTLTVSPFNIPGSSSSTAALTVSNEVPIAGVPFVHSLYAAVNGVVEQVNPQAGQLLSATTLPTGFSVGALSYASPAVTNSNPIVLLTYGGGQTLAQNSTSAPMVVRVLDSNAHPISGATVNFSTNGLGSTVSPATVTTQSTGYAVTYLTSGSTNGPLQVTATAGAKSTVFSMSVGLPNGGTVGGLTIVSGQGQILPPVYNTDTGLAGSHLSVLVSDKSGNPLPGAPVTFLITSGEGTLIIPTTGGSTSQTANSDTNGIATVDFLSPTVMGTAASLGFAQTQVSASAPGTNSLLFTLTTIPTDQPASIQQIKPQLGTVLQGQANQVVTDALEYQIISHTGYSIPGIGLTLSNGGQDPALYPSAKCNDPSGTGVVSDGSGTIICDLAIGPHIGSIALTPNIGYSVNLSPIELVVTAGPPAIVNLIGGNNQSGLPGATLSTALLVRVTDAGGNILVGAPVKWNVVTAGTATLSHVIGATDSNGRASAVVTLGNIAGPLQITATSGTATATFNLAVVI
ncbi:MAG TPA: Ig-like domain-containing protein, partial [Bryobacteraceae bacterium]